MDMEGDEICGRCLVNPNASIVMVAKWGDGKIEHAPSQVPATLKRWLQEMLYVNRARFEMGDIGQLVEAVSTWQGDPVCGYHLWQLATAEMRRGYA